VDLKALAQLDGVVLRLVEQQGAQATRRTTDSLDEQAWLEDFLEASKPELPSAEECAVRHRLLLTPFRYRKRHGSRFATRWERGLFYGSRSRFGCLLEGAYYELVFQDGPERPFPRSTAMRKAIFHVQVCTTRGLKLQDHGSRELQARLRDPVDSHFCLTWTPKTEPALMRASLSARLGQEKPHETQTPQPRAGHPQAENC
jgi:hypothetical protein